MPARSPAEVHQLWTEAINAGDLEGVMALYDPEASLAPQPGVEVVTGTAAIREASSGILALKPQFALQVRQVVQAGDLALLISPWTMAGTGPDGAPVTLEGTTADVVRRQPDGSWLFAIDNPFGTA